MRLTPFKTVSFHEDVWSTRVRHGTTEVLLYRVSGGVFLVGCGGGGRTGGDSDPADVDGFSPYTMVVEPRGLAAYLFGSDLEPYAIEIDFDLRRSRRLRLTPPGGIFTSVGWFEPNLNVIDTNGETWAFRRD